MRDPATYSRMVHVCLTTMKAVLETVVGADINRGSREAFGAVFRAWSPMPWMVHRGRRIKPQRGVAAAWTFAAFVIWRAEGVIGFCQ